MEGPVPGRPITHWGPGCSWADAGRPRGALPGATAQPGHVVGVGPQQAPLTGNDPFPAATFSKGPDLPSPPSAMEGCAEGERSRLRPRPERGEEMKVKEPPGSRPKDAALLAVTLLLALTSCCLSVVSLCRVAVLQAELGSLRTELRGPREPRELRAEPGPPRAGAATPGASGARLAPAVPSALKGIFAPAPAGESNSSQSGRRKRAALGPEDTVIQDCLQLIADSDTPTIRKELLCCLCIWRSTTSPTPHALTLPGRHFHWSAVLNISHSKARQEQGPLCFLLSLLEEKNLFSASPQSYKTKQNKTKQNKTKQNAGYKRLSCPFLCF
ncbi:tumor necrosis factor ligand superfamily member 13B isoform X2 [Leopardus geoffroyi]|uniref:tumor necrosis factor ligand superfamily member 13B isoform X2 n=1 Tax=Leopardus geoffroyi TaxID=46844 RepID=UPI001E2651FD|nr:tumor necrosis factor ligand superfamily member 13B isoform X2 [Leopardus geoffroyi]